MMKQVYIFLAEGFEEIEALTVVDFLRRGKVDVKMVSVSGSKMVTGSHAISVSTDITLEEALAKDVDAYVLPGGMPGTRNLQACAPLVEKLLEKYKEDNAYICAICAAPLVLGLNHLLEGKKACCYPGFEEDLLGAHVSYDPVSVDGKVITSRGMGTAIAFASEILAAISSKEHAKEIEESIIY